MLLAEIVVVVVVVGEDKPKDRISRLEKIYNGDNMANVATFLRLIAIFAPMDSTKRANTCYMYHQLNI